MNNPASPQDVIDSIERPLSADEVRVLPNWLDRAWRILNREVPGIAARNELPVENAAHLPADDVRDVVVAMVERKLRNPDGTRTWSGDDYSQTVDAALSSGQLYVTADERAGLMPVEDVGEPGMYSIPTTVR